MSEPAPAEVAHAAVDALLRVVAQSADDLRAFHDVISRARLSALPPFPRTQFRPMLSEYETSISPFGCMPPSQKALNGSVVM